MTADSDLNEARLETQRSTEIC